MVNNIEKFYNSSEEVIYFFRGYIEIFSNADYKSKQDKLRKQDLKNINT